MMGQRVGLKTGLVESSDFQVPLSTTPVDARHFRGYSYLLGEPNGATRTTIGREPATALEILTLLPFVATAAI